MSVNVLQMHDVWPKAFDQPRELLFGLRTEDCALKDLNSRGNILAGVQLAKINVADKEIGIGIRFVLRISHREKGHRMAGVAQGFRQAKRVDAVPTATIVTRIRQDDAHSRRLFSS